MILIIHYRVNVFSTRPPAYAVYCGRGFAEATFGLQIAQERNENRFFWFDPFFTKTQFPTTRLFLRKLYRQKQHLKRIGIQDTLTGKYINTHMAR